MRKAKSIIIYLWCIYAFIALFPLRFYIAKGSFVSLGQLAVIMFVFLCLAFNNKFKIYKTKDDRLMLVFVFFMVVNCLTQNIFQTDITLKFIQLRSLAVSLIIVFPYFISRSIKLDNHRKQFVTCLVIGMSLFVLYLMYGFLENYLTTGNKCAGRIQIGQRSPVVINFIFLIALLYKTKSRWQKVFSSFIAAVAFILMIVSLTRGVYISILVDLIILFVLKPKKTFRFITILIFILACISWKYSEKLAPLKVAGNRLEYMIEVMKNPSIDSSASDRITIWRAIVDHNLSNPFTFLFGSGELGIGRLDKTVMGFSGKWTIGSAHSQYFDEFIRRGITGLLLFLILNYRMIKISFKLRHDKDYGWFYTAIGIGYLAMLPYNVFEESFRLMTFGLFFYAIYGCIVSPFLVMKSKQAY